MAGTTEAVDEAAWERRTQTRLARGEAAALGEVYDRHARLVYAVAGRLTGDEKAAQEAVTHVFRLLWTQPDRFDAARTRLRTWFVSEVCAYVTTVRPGTPRVTHTAPERARLEAADTALSSMSLKARGMLRLIHQSMLTYQQAAQEMGLEPEEALDHVRDGLDLMLRCIGLPSGVDHG
ncbi:hypothetical protein GTW43_06845 [Streptomyces sp. SID5785]|uniref:RNA polymerase sigma factor n=1 Tax=Streptomyces sp. SID5785 TaxID=2690309 RepID=UPI001361125C|nr:sigma factor [Streptomyces sp. SID5785]MZD04800.1 hypothetical protein [Streptomyces sp. SID5785]